MILRNTMLSKGLIFGILLLFVTNALCADKNEQRNVSFYHNPNLPTNMSDYNINVVYLRSASNKDILHFVISVGNFTETPSIVLMRSSDLSSQLAIDWDMFTSSDVELRKHSIKQIGQNFTSHFGVVFTRIYRYNDVNDKVSMDGNYQIDAWTLNQFDWKVIWDEKTYNVTMISSVLKSGSELFKNGSQISLEFDYSQKEKPNNNMPRLKFNTNNIQFNLALKNLVTSFASPRFAFEFALINTDNKDTMFIKNDNSIDDEYSPGVFRTIDFYGQKTGNSDHQTYVQFKPVCYTKEKTFSLDAISVSKISNPTVLETPNAEHKNKTDVFKSSAVYLSYGDQIFQPASKTHLVNITFGISGDKFYKDYTIWTASFGTGAPPTYELSTMILLVIILGLGLPFVLVIVGSVYVIVKKRFTRIRAETYEKIND